MPTASLVGVLMLAACSSTSDTTALDPAGEAATGPAAGVALEEVVADFVGDGPGGADVLLIADGVTTVASAGAANSNGDPIAAGMAFRVGSISKPFIATMVLQIVDEGRLGLDDMLERYLPATSVGAGVTVRELLSHTSGLPNYTDQPAFFAEVFADPTRTFTPDDILGYVARVEPSAAGESFAYSNTNYILLGQLIENLEGTDLNTVMRTRIAEPIGLSSTRFALPREPGPNEVVGGWSNGFLDGDPDAAYDGITSGAWAAGALVSTTDDLAAFLQALFGGALVSSESLAQMTNTGSDGYGLGIFTASVRVGGSGYGHNGGIPGYTSTMAIDPASGDVLVVVTNSDALSADALALKILLR